MVLLCGLPQHESLLAATSRHSQAYQHLRVPSVAMTVKESGVCGSIIGLSDMNGNDTCSLIKLTKEHYSL